MEKTPSAAPGQACHIDWSSPSRHEPLDVSADILIAADVTYAPEHVAWLRECDKSLLFDGLMREYPGLWSVRLNGKIFGIGDNGEVAFRDEKICSRPHGEKLSISSVQMKSTTNYSSRLGMMPNLHCRFPGESCGSFSIH